MSANILAIGLDGATWDILTPFIEEGIMPNLGKIVETGASGMLESTYPPISPTAWASFMTGSNPAKHGIYSFTLKKAGSYYVQPATYSDIICPTIWDILSQNNRRVAAINLPMSYPPGKINGIMVSGMGTPGKEYPYCYPPELSSELDEIANDYVIDIMWAQYSDNQIDRFIEEIKESTNKRFEVVRRLLARETWDLFMVVFAETDRIQHRLWQAFDNNSDADFESLRRKVINYYSELDEIIGTLLDLNKDGELTIILSDHGFGRYHKSIEINNLLERLGFLKYSQEENIKKPGIMGLMKKTAKSLGFRRQHFVNIMQRFTSLDPYSYLDRANQSSNIIDWSQTRAFCYSVDGIYINLKGRERKGIVNSGGEYENLKKEIADKLCSVIDPETGNKIFQKVVPRENVYDGGYLSDAPDLLITEYDRQYMCQFQLFSDNPQKDIFFMEPHRTGYHRMDGIILVQGKNVKRAAKIDGARLIDIAPTILKRLGLPISRAMDGRYLSEVFERNGKSDVQAKECDTEFVISRREKPQSSVNEEKEILNRLKGLGYVE